MGRSLESKEWSALGRSGASVRRSNALAFRLDTWSAKDAAQVQHHPAARERVVAALQRALAAVEVEVVVE